MGTAACRAGICPGRDGRKAQEPGSGVRKILGADWTDASLRTRTIVERSDTQPVNIKGYALIADTIPGFNVTSPFGLVVRAGTPRTIIDKIQQDSARVLNKPDVKARLETLGLEVVGSTPEAFESFARTELAKWAKVIKASNIKGD